MTEPSDGRKTYPALIVGLLLLLAAAGLLREVSHRQLGRQIAVASASNGREGHVRGHP